MKRPDFDFTKHIEVPEEWIEKALAIPSAERVKPRPLVLRRLAAVASSVLVFGLSVGLYFYIRNMHHPDSVAAPSPAPVEALPPSEPQPSASVNTGAPGVPSSQPTENPSAATPAPTELSSHPVPTVPTAAKPTTADNSAAPTTAPSAAAPERPGTPTAPPEHETGTAPQQAEPPDDPTASSSVDIEILVPYAVADYQLVSCEDNQTIYCRLYSSSGALIGDGDLYAPSHLAYVLDTNDGPCLYYAQEVPAAVSSGCTYVFYDDGGVTLKSGRL